MPIDEESKDLAKGSFLDRYKETSKLIPKSGKKLLPAQRPLKTLDLGISVECRDGNNKIPQDATPTLSFDKKNKKLLYKTKPDEEPVPLTFDAKTGGSNEISIHIDAAARKLV